MVSVLLGHIVSTQTARATHTEKLAFDRDQAARRVGGEQFVVDLRIGPSSQNDAIDYFERALKLDPDLMMAKTSRSRSRIFPASRAFSRSMDMQATALPPAHMRPAESELSSPFRRANCPTAPRLPLTSRTTMPLPLITRAAWRQEIGGRPRRWRSDIASTCTQAAATFRWADSLLVFQGPRARHGSTS